MSTRAQFHYGKSTQWKILPDYIMFNMTTLNKNPQTTELYIQNDFKYDLKNPRTGKKPRKKISICQTLVAFKQLNGE